MTAGGSRRPLTLILRAREHKGTLAKQQELAARECASKPPEPWAAARQIMIYDQLMQIYSSKAEVQFLCRVVNGRARAQASVLFDGLIPRPHTRSFDSIF